MTGVIADTHALIWYLLDSPRLSAPALAQFEMCQTAGSKVGVSSISIVGIIYLIEKGRIPPTTLPLLEEGLLERPALLEIIPVTNLIALTVQHVPRQQILDLPDRIIAATALHLDVPLITRDRKIRLSRVATVW